MIYFTGWTAVVVLFVVITSWFVNAYKLTECDFKAPYACEVVHAVGLVPLIAPVAVFIDPSEAP